METIKNSRATVGLRDKTVEEGTTGHVQFHWFVKFWIWLIIICNVISIVLFFWVGQYRPQPAYVASLSFFSFVSAYSAWLMHKKYKIGLILLMLSVLVVQVLQIMERGLSVQLVGFAIGLLFIWAIFCKIKKNGISFWSGARNLLPKPEIQKMILVWGIIAIVLFVCANLLIKY